MAGNFFQQAFEKTKSFANQAVDSTKCAAQKTKIKGKISSETSNLDKIYTEIGRYYYNLNKDAAPEEIKQLFDNAAQSLAAIATLEKEYREVEEQEHRAMNGGNQYQQNGMYNQPNGMPPWGVYNQPNGMPPQGMYPQNGMPPQGMNPQSGMPPQGMNPQSGMPPQGMNPQGGMPPQGMNPQSGMPPQGMYNQPNGMPPQGMNPQNGMPPQGMPAGQPEVSQKEPIQAAMGAVAPEEEASQVAPETVS